MKQEEKPTAKLSKWQKRTKKKLDRRLATVDKLRRLIECGSIATEDWEEANHLIQQGRIHSAVYDSGATSHCGRTCDPFRRTARKSNKIFHIPDGNTIQATDEAKLHHQVREPARTVHMVPSLKHNSLLSASKFADAGYISILTPTEVIILEEDKYAQHVPKEAILRGWRDHATGLWRVPLEPGPPLKAEHILLEKEVEEAVSNVYELPSTKEIIRYLHACAGFPTKTTWLNAIRKGSYATWPHLTLEAAAKHFPESDETLQGHMRGIKQGI